jgi:CRP-like cAMP-binding protein
MVSFAEEYGQIQPGGEILIPLRLTQTDLAELVGASRERVNRVLADYKSRKLLALDQGHRGTVCNLEGLRKRSA